MSSRSWHRRLAVVALGGMGVAIVFAFVLPRIAGYGAVWATLSRLTWAWAAVLVAATVANILTFPLPWMIALPSLGFVNALRMTQASTAFSLVVPGGAAAGMAASFSMLRSWGLDGRPVGVAVAVTGIWNQLSTFAFPIVAVAFLTAEGAGSGPLGLLALIGLALSVGMAGGAAAILARPEFAHRVGELSRRVVAPVYRWRRRGAPGWGGEAVVRFRAEALGLLRRRWVALTATTLANQLTGYLIFELSLRAVGISRSEISVSESFAAWSVGRLLVSLPLTPGGVGVVELGLSGILVGFGGPGAEVISGVLLYRALSVVPALVLGLLFGATWKLRRRPDPLPHP